MRAQGPARQADAVLARTVVGANHFFVLGALGVVPWVVVLFVHGGPGAVRAAWVELGVIGVWGVCLLLNRRRHFVVAAVVSLVVPMVAFTWLTDLFSRDSGYQLPVLAASAMAFLVFTRRLWWWRLLIAMAGAALLVWIHVDPRFGAAASIVDDRWTPVLAVRNVLSVAVLMYALASIDAYFYVRERQRNARLLREAEVASQTDALTDVLNRRGVIPVLTQVTHAGDYAVALIDLDKFKRVNDRLGHSEGDTVLRCVAQALAAAVGPDRAVSRWGGEEFLVVLPGADLHGAVAVLEDARRAVETLYAGIASHPAVTVSVGVAAASRGTDWEDAVRAADARLYEAKASGRNTVAGGTVVDPEISCGGMARAPRGA